MPDLNLSYITGQTVTAALYNGATKVGADISMTEVSTLGEYFADVPIGTAANKYSVVFSSGGSKIVSGPLYWDGTKEVTPATLETQIDALPVASATAVRTELVTELGRIDTSVSSRLATSGYTAPDNTAIGNIASLVDALPTISEIEASTVIAKTSDVTAVSTAVDALPTLTEIEASTVIAKASTVAAVKTVVDGLPTLTGIESSNVLAKKADVTTVSNAVADVKTAVDTLPDAAEIATQVEVAIINEDDGQQVLKAISDKIMAEEVSATVIAQAVRTELTTELGRMDVAVSSRPSLTQIEGSTVLAKKSDIDSIAGGASDAFLAAEVEPGTTVVESLRLANSVLGGKVSGAGTTTETFRDLADSKDRVVSTVDDKGNRTAVVRDLS